VSEAASHVLAEPFNVRGQRREPVAVIEEYLDGPEFSVEAFQYDGDLVFFAVTEKAVVNAPYFVESRHIFPAALPAASRRAVRTAALSALREVGIREGPTHTELKLTPNGWSVLEINPRLAGGMIPELVRLATGVDLLEQQLRLALGLPLTFAPRRTSYAGIQMLLASRDGRLAAVSGVEEVRQRDGTIAVVLTTELGSSIGRARNAYGRLGYVICQGKTRAQLLRRLEAAQSGINLIVLHDLENTSVPT
jgi:cysteine synthase A